MEDRLVHRELSYVVRGCIFDVHNEVGPGLREECYQKAMEHRLFQGGVPLLAKPATRRDLVHHGVMIETFEPDFVVAEQIVLELKAQRDGLCGENFAQLLSYLTLWDLRLGLLANFGQSQAVIERLPNLPHQVIVEEDYGFIKHLVGPELKPALAAVRESLLAIQQKFGCGYYDTTYRKLVEVELRHRGLACQPVTFVTASFPDRQLPSSPISPLVVERAILLETQAIHDEIAATAIRTMQTHLRCSACPVGLIASFGKSRFSIRGVHP